MEKWPTDEYSRRVERRARAALLQEEVRIVQQKIGAEIAAKVLPPGSVVERLDKELFRSPGFVPGPYIPALADHSLPADGSLTRIAFKGGSQVFVIDGKVSSGNPYERAFADLRSTELVVFAYDGDQTITEYAGDHLRTHTGEYGKPEVALAHAREALGEAVGGESYTAPTF